MDTITTNYFAGNLEIRGACTPHQRWEAYSMVHPPRWYSYRDAQN